MKYLVTGANGFLGRYIAEQLLTRGETVRAMVRKDDPDLRRQGAEIFIADVRNADAVNAACVHQEVVIHVASIAGIWGSWRLYHETNTLGAWNVIKACRANQARALVYTSTPSVTFEAEDQCGINEDAPYAKRWLSHYPHSKKLAEEMVLNANNPQGLRTCALRPHLIWGPGDSHLIPRLLRRARDGSLRRIGNGDNLIDIVYVENAAEAHLRAADALLDSASPAGKPYFISQGEPVNCWRWINELISLAGLPPVQKSVPFSLAWLLGASLEGAWRVARIRREPSMTRFLAAQLAMSHYFDISRAREAFGYSPRISISEGMRKLAETLRNSGPNVASLSYQR